MLSVDCSQYIFKKRMAYNTYYYIKSENRCCEFNSATQHRPCKRQSLFVSEASDLSVSVYFPSHNDTFGVVRCRNMATQHAVPGVPSRSLSNQLASCAMCAIWASRASEPPLRGKQRNTEKLWATIKIGLLSAPASRLLLSMSTL